MALSFIWIWVAQLINGDSASVSVKYRGRPTISTGSFGGFYFENDYAYNLGIDLIGDPHNFGRSWFPCFDNFVERATYDINIISSNGRRGYAIGDFLGEEVIQGDTLRRKYSMKQQLPTYLVGVAISDYAEVNFTHSGLNGDIPVQLISKAKDSVETKQSLFYLPDAIDGLEYWFGPYQWNRVGYVITTRGAMEHSTSIAYPESSITDGVLSTRLMAHELCHHWWGNYVTVNYAPDMWIKEGNAEYGAHLVQGWIGGPDVFRESVRNNHFTVINTAHNTDGSYLALSPMPQEQTYGRHTYNKGASMMRNLHAYLGDELFRSGMTEVLDRNQYSFMNAQKFRDELTLVTGMNMTSFFNDWIFSPGWSDFQLQSFDEDMDSLTINIRQAQYESGHYHENVPLKIRIFNEDTFLDATVHVSGANSVVRLEKPLSNVTSIAINPDNHMNLAMFEIHEEISEVRTIQDAATGFNINMSEVRDSCSLNLTHHFTAADNEDDTQFRISNNHYWHFSGNFDGKIDASAQYRFSNAEKPYFDHDVVPGIEDSLVVLYRKDANSPWSIYPEHRVIALTPGDGSGIIIIDSLTTGDFALGVDLLLNSAVINVKDNLRPLTITPNPINDQFSISAENLNDIQSIEVFEVNGKRIHMNKVTSVNGEPILISCDSWASGNYLIYMKDIRGKTVGVGMVSKVE